MGARVPVTRDLLDAKTHFRSLGEEMATLEPFENVWGPRTAKWILSTQRTVVDDEDRWPEGEAPRQEARQEA